MVDCFICLIFVEEINQLKIIIMKITIKDMVLALLFWLVVLGIGLSI